MGINPDKTLAIPFGALSVSAYARELINEALDKNRLSCGALVKRFEEEFAALHGVKEAVAVSTGTDADTLALAVLHDFGAKRGDEVVVPALSFVATGNAVLHAGFEPVFVDVGLDTLNILPERIEEAITPKTRAIMPVHLMGKPADMDAVNAIAKKHGLVVVEDAAEAHGAKYKGKPAGALADMAAFSTYVAHIISTVEGGVVTTNREDYAEILRSLRSHGRGCTCKTCVMNAGATYCPKRFGDPVHEDIRFIFNRVGYSAKMNEMEAAVGLGNLRNYNDILAKRHDNLMRGIAVVDKFAPFLSTIHEEAHETIGPHALPIIVSKDAPFTRKELINHLSRFHIDSRTLFEAMPTQCRGFAYQGRRLGEFPNAEFLGTNGIHIGVHQDLDARHFEYLEEVLNEFMRSAMR